MSQQQPKSIEYHIDFLARRSGAPEAFVRQVKQVFDRKGISLGEDAAPYVQALEEAFRREENIRFGTTRARESIDSMQRNFQRIGKAYVDQLSQLKRIQSSLRSESNRLRGKVDAMRASGTTYQVTIKGDHRTLVTPMVREELPMVPGPEEIQ